MRQLSRRTGRTLCAFLVGAVLAMVLASPASAVVVSTPAIAIQQGATYAYDTAVYNCDAPAYLSSKSAATSGARGSPAGLGAVSWGRSASVRDLGVAANTARAGADDVLNGVRLRAQLTGEEISGGHAFQKHVLDQAEFPGITTRPQFASHIEDVVLNGEMRTLSGGRTGYWQNGTVVIRNPGAVDGGTAFRPTTGYDYFLNTLH